MPTKLSTSRGIAPIDARTEKTGFLHLPNQVRYRIYELAIYDHDRGAVFLPRAVPRKVSPSDDVDITEISNDDNEQADGSNETPHIQVVEMVGVHDDTRAAGRWTNGEDSDASAVASRVGRGVSPSLGSQDDTTMSDGTHIKEEISDDDQSYTDVTQCSACACRVCLSCLGIVGEWEKCMCNCHARDAGYPSDSEDPLAKVSDDESLISGISYTGVRKDVFLARITCECQGTRKEVVSTQYIAAPEGCLQGSCIDTTCEHCADQGLGPDQASEVYGTNDDDLPEEESDDEEDEEHFDSGEQIGMLYEPKEPAILLACRDIRHQCLPLYYALNSFSWRFLWLDHAHAKKRFRAWVQALTDDSAGLIRQISFESRHEVAEGIGFTADIDLLKHSPFFSVCISSDYSTDEETACIKIELERSLIWQLWKWSKGGTVRIFFNVQRLMDLSSLFLKAMSQEVGGLTESGLDNLFHKKPAVPEST